MLAVFALFAGAYAQERTAVQLAEQVQKEILRLPNYEVFDYITFDIKGDTVYLSGKVRNASNKSTLENIVEDLDGVSNVVNNIEALPPSRSDEVIRQRLVNSIGEMGNIGQYISWINPPVRLIVDRGHITLEGAVRTATDRNMMTIAARTVPGVFSVTNNLQVTDEVP